METLADRRITSIEHTDPDREEQDHTHRYLLEYENEEFSSAIAILYNPSEGVIQIVEIVPQIDPLYLNKIRDEKAKALLGWWDSSFPQTSFALNVNNPRTVILSAEKSSVKHSFDDLKGWINELIVQTPLLVNKVFELAHA